ncbi:MAG TPA: polysaccharide deacetylase family protein [Thermoanaerobaculia bacterium]|nr:polysaccharide deacetylase family protein [Thermoanaerobaculia bacterium]
MEARRLWLRSWRPTPFLAASAGLHAAALAALAVVPHHWRPICAAALADHVAIAAAGLWPQGRLLGGNLSRLPPEAARRGEIALTFDDGPDPRATPGVLDLLDRYGARATFFCIGRRAAAQPELAAEIARRGHRVENHTHSHPPAFSLYTPWSIAREVALAQEELERAAGRPPRYFRAPAGLRNFWLDPVLTAAGLTLVSWTRRAFDTVRGRAAGIAADLLRGLAAGDVLLLHDGSAARAPGGAPVVLEALPRVLDGIAARGLRAVPFAAGEGPE